MIALIAATVVTFKTSPWPGALLIRPLFEADARNVKKRMAGFAPTGIASILNETYRPGDRDAKLDIYWPSSANTDSAFPTIFWLHGGAWISGHRNDASAFLQLIAAQGFTVISVGFSNSPRKMYPTALFQINDAVAYVQQHADRLHVNPHMFAFAGDSSGA
ncbi:MAG: alpha/beta hydrolase fold domain-containing protein [Thermomicrobiales bacterium]